MITAKVIGVEEMVKRLRDTKAILPAELIDKAVKEASLEVVSTLKQNYIAAGHKKTGELVRSIKTFKRKRKGRNDPYFTYYVGPEYNGRVMRGNIAHILEYGTAERYRANVKAGGVGKTLKGKSTGIKGVYGEKIKTGKVDKPAIGVIRNTIDTIGAHISQTMGKKIYDAILTRWENRGGKFYK